MTLTPVDVRLRDAVVRQLDWDPGVDDSQIGVSAKDGVVTLTGFTDTYAGKLAAERIAKRVRGVRAIANDIVVRLKVERTDPDIAADAARALTTAPGVPESVQASVHNGHVTMTGTVEWLLQKEYAESAIHNVRGVKGLANRIEVSPKATKHDVHRRITQALHRHADLDAHNITVTVIEDTVKLTGTVPSWLQRETAERAASCAPGIRHVDNDIHVVPAEP
jgi:osmotically-inducible protein OsmY